MLCTMCSDGGQTCCSAELRLNSRAIGMHTIVDFNTMLLAEAVDSLPAEQVNSLPFEAIRLDANGAVTFHGGAGKRRTGSRGAVLKQSATNGTVPSTTVQSYRGCIERALAQSHPDLEFSHVFGLSAGTQDIEVRVRVQPAKDGGRWVFFQRQG